MYVAQGEERKQVIHSYIHSFIYSFIHSGNAASTDPKASLPALLASSASYPFTSALAPLKYLLLIITVLTPQVVRVK